MQLIAVEEDQAENEPHQSAYFRPSQIFYDSSSHSSTKSLSSNQSSEIEIETTPITYSKFQTPENAVQTQSKLKSIQYFTSEKKKKKKLEDFPLSPQSYNFNQSSSVFSLPPQSAIIFRGGEEVYITKTIYSTQIQKEDDLKASVIRRRSRTANFSQEISPRKRIGSVKNDEHGFNNFQDIKRSSFAMSLQREKEINNRNSPIKRHYSKKLSTVRESNLFEVNEKESDCDDSIKGQDSSRGRIKVSFKESTLKTNQEFAQVLRTTNSIYSQDLNDDQGLNQILRSSHSIYFDSSFKQKLQKILNFEFPNIKELILNNLENKIVQGTLLILLILVFLLLVLLVAYLKFLCQ